MQAFMEDSLKDTMTGILEIMDLPFSREPIKIERKIIKKVIKHNKKK